LPIGATFPETASRLTLAPARAAARPSRRGQWRPSTQIGASRSSATTSYVDGDAWAAAETTPSKPGARRCHPLTGSARASLVAASIFPIALALRRCLERGLRGAPGGWRGWQAPPLRPPPLFATTNTTYEHGRTTKLCRCLPPRKAPRPRLLISCGVVRGCARAASFAPEGV